MTNETKKIPNGIEETPRAIDILSGNDDSKSAVIEFLDLLDKAKANTDPWNPNLKKETVRVLDDAGIYGKNILKLHEICRRDIYLTSACLRACTIPQIPLTGSNLKNAIDGKYTLDPKRIIAEVQKYIPRYGANTKHDPLQALRMTGPN